MNTLKNNSIKQGSFNVSIKYFFILFLFSSFLLTGCGGDDDEDPAPTNTSGQGTNDDDDNSGSGQDSTPPEVVSITPEDGATDISVDVVIEITLSETVDIETVKTGNVILSGGASSDLAWTWEMTGTSVTLTPDQPLQKGIEYLLRITSGVEDLAGNGFAQTFSSRFTTVEGDFVDVITNEVTNITETTAFVAGEFTSNIDVTEKGFVYAGGTVTPTVDDIKVVVSSGSSSGFTYELIGLNSSATYSVRAYTQSSLGVTYGQTRTFTTLATPDVQTKNAEGIINRSGFVGGQIDARGRSLERYGVVWSLSTNPDLSSNVIDAGDNASDFTEELKDRDVNQTIYYKAFAVVSGTGLVVYGPEKSFTTLNIKANNIMSLRYSSLDNRTIIGEMKVDGLINSNFIWLEINNEGTFEFEETDIDEWSNYLFDAGRNVSLQIDTYVGSVFIFNNDGTKTEIYKIREMYTNSDFTNAANSGRQMRR